MNTSNNRFLTDDEVLLDFDIKISNLETDIINGFNMSLFYNLINTIQSIKNPNGNQYSPISVKVQRIKAFRNFFLDTRFTPHRSSLVGLADAKYIIEAWDDFKDYVIKHARLPSEMYPTLHHVKRLFQINK